MRIDVHFDVICPWCFVGFQRLQLALRERPHIQPEFHWHPYFLNQAPEDYSLDFFSYMEKRIGGSLRVERLLYTFKEIGEVVDIQFNFQNISSIPNTLNAHKLVRLAETIDRQTEMVHALFLAYFTRGLDIGDPTVLEGIASEFGFDAQETQALFDDEQLSGSIIRDVQTMKRSGANGIPFYVLENAFQITGAHEPEVLVRLIDVARTFRENASDFASLQAMAMTTAQQSALTTA